MSNTMLNCREFSVQVRGQSLRCLLAEPNRLSQRPALLLNLAAGSITTMHTAPYDITPRMFVAAGHRAVSFDLPCHGEREIPGQPRGIPGFYAEWTNGRDVFSQFVEDGHAVLDALIQRGLAEPGRIFISGTSRGAYCALRLMAADKRVEATAAFMPVTDWRVLKEFSAAKDGPQLADLALTCFAGAFAGRAVWTAIGNCDARVETACCLRFAEAVISAEAATGRDCSRFVLHVVPGAGHSLSGNWRRRGGEYLLDMAGSEK